MMASTTKQTDLYGFEPEFIKLFGAIEKHANFATRLTAKGWCLSSVGRAKD